MLEYINNNKEWIFSGAGIAVLSVISVYARKSFPYVFSVIAKSFRERVHFKPRERGHAIERYMITDIYRFDVKNDVYDLAQLQLVKSTISNGCGFAGIHVDQDKIVFHHYGFANNCLHAVIAPGDVLLDRDAKSLKAQSNEFSSITINHNPTQIPKELLPKKYLNSTIDCLLVTMEFSFPKTYTGPMYKSKSLVFAKGIGLIKAVTTYRDGQTDEFTLKNHRVKEANNAWWPVHTLGNYWEYDISYAKGPNKVNIKHG